LEEIEEGEEAAEEITASTEPDEEQALPDWLAGSAALAGAAALAATGREGTPEEEQQPEAETGLLSWLESPELVTDTSLASGAAGVLEIEEPEIIEGDTQPAGIGVVSEEFIAGQEAPISEIETEEVQPAPAEAISDEDAAFAWLEGLAVRQGASEALLITPEERLDEPPEWVQKAAEEAEAEAPVPELSQEPADGLRDERATEIVDEELPDWLIGAAAGSVAAAGVHLAKGEEEPAIQEAQPDLGEPVPDTASVPEGPPSVEGEIESAYAWLESLATVQETGEAEPEITAEVVETEESELPDWLAGLEPEMVETESLESTWTPDMAGITPAPEPEPLEALAPLLDLNQAALIQIERLPGVGFRRAQALVEYRQEHGPLNSLDELVNVEGFDPEIVDSLAGYAVVITPLAPARVETVQESQPAPEETAPIEQAAAYTILKDYPELIRQPDKLLQVVYDLQEAVRTQPQDVSLWMALGDAQMRLGQVQEALESYNTAEELL
jgi:competence ComEA-like helix-hairpin-helix protein